MKIKYESGQICQVVAVDVLGGHWTLGRELMIDDAVQCAEDILEGRYIFYPSQVEKVYIVDDDTGELLATCIHDEPKPVEDESWESFNEDCGFDPYLGCYTEDC